MGTICTYNAHICDAFNLLVGHDVCTQCIVVMSVCMKADCMHLGTHSKVAGLTTHGI